MLDMTQFNPFHIDTRKRFLLYKLHQPTVSFQFYNVNMGFNGTLISLEPVINILDSVTQIERVQAFFTYQNEKHNYKFNLVNINQLKNYKIIINNILNFPGPIYMIDNNFLINFITFKINNLYSTVFTITAFWNSDIQKWDSSHIQYNIFNGTLVGFVNLKPIFSINFKQLLIFNNIYYLEYDKNDNNILVGSIKSYNYRNTSRTIANICEARELNYMNPMNGNELINYKPLDQYYYLLCFSDDRSNFYLCGFTGINSPENFYTIAQSTTYLQLVQTMIYAIFVTSFTKIKLEQKPIFDFDGCIIWYNIDTDSFIIYEPTFPEFIKLHSVEYQGLQDLIW
jgi:hypothetical protein